VIRRRADPPAIAPQPEVTAALSARMQVSGQTKLGRSLSALHVNAGDCGGCTLELRALTNAVYALERFGLRFTTSPADADLLLVSGPVTRAMEEALLRAWEAMPAPKWVVAVGDCAIDGGVFRGGYAVLNGAARLPVDLVIRGCPPAPAQILSGLRSLVEANAAAPRATAFRTPR
jgi:Ni,Fe-hydrogenase III small subunit